MLRRAVLILTLLTLPAVARGQMTSAHVSVVTVYSQNGRYHLRSVPYDDESPSPRGKTYVYEEGREEPLYTFERGFDSVEDDSNNLILSDDGETIFYAITWGADEEREGMKSVNLYRRGVLLRGYTETEVNGCDKKRERCSLVYTNYEQVVDLAKSRFGGPNYKKAYKEGVSDEEKFLSDFALFSNGDTVYLTDSKKRVHLFDLKQGVLAGSDSFENLYERMKREARFTRVKLEDYDMTALLDFPRLKDGGDAHQRLAAHLGLKVWDMSKESDYRYKWYTAKVSGTLRRNDGVFEVEAMEVDDGLSKEAVAEFLNSNRFDTSPIPAVFDKWHFDEEYFNFRKSDARLARRERREQEAEQQRELQKRLTAETIEGDYIPANLGECFVELDKALSEIDREEMRKLPKREDMIRYHHGLGMWMRNTWRLWAGSRLSKYFSDRGVHHPEAMSTVILYHYHDWLNGRRETWKEWEKKPGEVLK